MGVGRVVWAGALAAGACAIGMGAMRGDGPEVDRELFDLLNRGHGPAADGYFAGVTELGSLYASGAAAGALAVSGRGRPAIRALAAAGATWLLLQGMKKAIDR